MKRIERKKARIRKKRHRPLSSSLIEVQRGFMRLPARLCPLDTYTRTQSALRSQRMYRLLSVVCSRLPDTGPSAHSSSEPSRLSSPSLPHVERNDNRTSGRTDKTSLVEGLVLQHLQRPQHGLILSLSRSVVLPSLCAPVSHSLNPPSVLPAEYSMRVSHSSHLV